ncbi:MAG: hypothetical protein PHF00_06445 [Elusimicrobia bacterium]|nr:hypothetical protein [Elusimicrobiota bacterium]
MNPDRRRRHPAFEGVVFGLAILLAGIVAFYSIERYAARRAPPQPPPLPAGATTAGSPPGGPAAQSVVSGLPPMRFSRVSSSRARRIDVPPPAAGGK